MRKFATVLVLAFALALAACGGGNSSSSTPTITMGSSDFTPSNPTVTIKAGQSVKFVDSTSTIHILFTGSNGTYQANPNAPVVLNTNTGDKFSGNDNQAIMFSTAGTYKITCQVHPSMEATIIVNP